MNEDKINHNKISYIFGKKIKDQAKLLRAARQESHKWRKIKLDKSHYNYLVGFFKNNYLLIIGLLALLFASGIIETTLLIASRNQLTGQARIFINHYFWYFFPAFIVIFLINSYFAVKYERSVIVILANSIRRRIFKDYINRTPNSFHSDQQASLIAKISYHLPLVSMGVSNTFFSFWRWLIYLVIVLVISLVSGFNVWALMLFFIVISGVLLVASYFVARFYISQEVTFYSRIIKEVDFNASNLEFVKLFNQEDAVLNKFDKLVWFDSFFRVKRDVLLRIGFKVVFALLIVISLLSHFFANNFFAFIGLDSSGEKLFFIFLIIYFSRALYEAVRIGLYLFPARLGLILTILAPSRSWLKNALLSIKGKTITFYSHKLKLFKEGTYYRNLRFVFSSRDRVLFLGDNLSGKSSLAKLLAGLSAYNHLAAKVIVGQERLDYHAWQKMCSDVFFFDPNFKTSRSLMEYIIGKTNDIINQADIERALQIISQYPEIFKLVAANGNYNVPSDGVLSNPIRAFALQALHCLVNDYYLIVIDNLWLDLNYSVIFDMIKLLDKAAPEAIIVVFAKAENNCLIYNHKYEIKNEVTSQKK